MGWNAGSVGRRNSLRWKLPASVSRDDALGGFATGVACAASCHALLGGFAWRFYLEVSQPELPALLPAMRCLEVDACLCQPPGFLCHKHKGRQVS